ncbi:hypothetical protein [Tropicimonas marinistellae]|uniref:hypothetical protein n=1 Tax=Tropicimonas marinistellae TaxID=1739787 RepID=UPI001F262574|nr:hypothetical protein [Tropicimonas marinistellae]
MYCQLEDDHAMVERAVRAAAQARHMEDGDMVKPLRAVGRDVLHEVMKLARDRSMQMIVMDAESRTPVVKREIEEKFRQLITQSGADVVVFDPLAVFYGSPLVTME